MAGGPAVAGAGIGASAPKNRAVGIFMVAFAAFGGILYGYDTGTISGIIAMDDWLRTFGEYKPSATDPTTYPWVISTSNESLIVSILSAGTFFGKQRSLVLLPSSSPTMHQASPSKTAVNEPTRP